MNKIKSIKDENVNIIRGSLKFQFNISWQMLEYHLSSLENEEYLWRPSSKGLHIHNKTGIWHADWPESEAYEIGPASIAWITWHITYWWEMVFDYSFGNGTLTREDIICYGNIKETKEKIRLLHNRWEKVLTELSVDEIISIDRTKWPFTDRAFHELAAWLNLELMKNAAEIGYCRFLYASTN